MSKIPYFFETPVPKYFRENGWFESEHMFKFIHWAFSRCQAIPHKCLVHGREITLAPFEFISGRLTSSKECFLSENVFRNQQFLLIRGGLLKKSTNSLTNHFTVYTWVTERFSVSNNQPNNQPSTNHQPTINHEERYKNIRKKNHHHPYPSSSSPLPDQGDGDDDFSSKNFSSEHHQSKPTHSESEGKLTPDLSPLPSPKTKPTPTPKSSPKSSPIPPAKPITLPFSHTFQTPDGETHTITLDQNDLEECLAIKGSLPKVVEAMEFITKSPRRKSPIFSWPNALRTWKIAENFQSRIQLNREMGDRLCENYSDSMGYRCEKYKDPVKDIEGVLFYSTASAGNPPTFFIPFSDYEFKQNCLRIIRDKNMQKSLKSNYLQKIADQK